MPFNNDIVTHKLKTFFDTDNLVKFIVNSLNKIDKAKPISNVQMRSLFKKIKDSSKLYEHISTAENEERMQEVLVSAIFVRLDYASEAVKLRVQKAADRDLEGRLILEHDRKVFKMGVGLPNENAYGKGMAKSMYLEMELEQQWNSRN